jgi:hypothetical protein
VVANRGSEHPVADKNGEREEHQNHAQLEHACERSGSLALTNCGRNAKKKIERFGLRMLISMAEMIT